MTSPNPLNSISVGTLVAEAQKDLDAIASALALIDKFAVLLPAQYRTPLESLEKLITTINGYVQKL